MKYQVGDTVWFQHGYETFEGKILGIGFSGFDNKEMYIIDLKGRPVSRSEGMVIAKKEKEQWEQATICDCYSCQHGGQKPPSVDEVREAWASGWKIGFATGWVACCLIVLIAFMTWKVVFYPSY